MIKEKAMLDTLELCIEQAVEDVFPGCRDDVMNPYDMFGAAKYPAWVLVSLYIDHGCSLENLASELLMIDFRKRRINRYPTIDKLYQEYSDMKNNPFTSGHKLRTYRAMCEDRLYKRLSKL